LKNGEIKNGFAMVRPPGHHAMRVVHGNRGFCNINNEAILVEYLRSKYGIRRIAIVDTDVHHGDGTQDIFYHDPDILFISMHQDGRTIFPGTGFVDEAGGPGAYLKTINIPLPTGMTDDGFLKVWREIIKPALDIFQPELIINSAGQDNHFTDPLANMKVTANGYAKLTEELKPDLAVLEGGYAVETALPYVNLAILLALAGEDYSCVIEPQRHKADLRQARDVSLTIDKLIAYWQDRLNQATPDKESLFGKDRRYKRQRSIFYDTDHILEKQLETVEYCPDCLGLYQVSSSAPRELGKGYSIRGIPLYACNSCQERAYEYWERIKVNNIRKVEYDVLYLQDKKNNRYLKESR
jgi:hypothetical protein